MHRRMLPLKLALLFFFGVFLIYPLAYVIPNSASDVVFQVRILDLGSTPEDRANALALLLKSIPDQQFSEKSFSLPFTLRSFPTEIPAKNLAEQLQKAGARAEVVSKRRWTGVFFQEALGFQLLGSPSFPFFRIQPNSPFLW
jgi:hypothetical protein